MENLIVIGVTVNFPLQLLLLVIGVLDSFFFRDLAHLGVRAHLQVNLLVVVQIRRSSNIEWKVRVCIDGGVKRTTWCHLSCQPDVGLRRQAERRLTIEGWNGVEGHVAVISSAVHARLEHHRGLIQINGIFEVAPTSKHFRLLNVG